MKVKYKRLKIEMYEHHSPNLKKKKKKNIIPLIRFEAKGLFVFFCIHSPAVIFYFLWLMCLGSWYVHELRF